MKNKISRIITLACSAITLIAVTSTAHAEAEPKHPLKPLLWKVEGKGLTQPSYLFGTIHISKGPAVTLHPAARQAFDASSNFYTEIPMDTESQMAMMPLMMRRDGKTLDESIGKDLAEELNAELKLINPALNSTPFQSMSTWAAPVILQMLPHQLEGGKPLDLILWEKATAAGKKTAGMEKPDAQLIGFTQLTEAEQVILLSETLRTLKKERAAGKNSTADLIAAYVTGEPAKIVTEVDRGVLEMTKGEHKELGEKLLRRLLTDRDRTMADFIAATLKERPGNSHFFAAGALHFCAASSIPSLLTQAGYTVTRLER